MPVVTRPRAVWLSAICAVLLFLPAAANSWAGDDQPIVEANPVVHSVAAAREAFFSTYWPVSEGHEAGQYRPIVILSYAVDWVLSGGTPAWFHLINVLMHGLVTALFVAVILAWLPPTGALAAGLLFAVHPVHVEAVAQVVGRAELFAAAGIFGAILAARRYRRASGSRQRAGWLALALLSCGWGLLSKEHAVVTIALLALDELVDDHRDFRRSAHLYVMVSVLTLAWFQLFRGIAGLYVATSEAATIRGMSTFERFATMLPAQLHVIRLLAWPMDLAADYNPLLIEQRTEWSVLATVGLVNMTALLTLGLLLLRRARAVAFGVLGGAITYLPAANLLFASGIILAERNLYLLAMAPCAAVGWLVHRGPNRERTRWITAVAWGALVTAFAFRTEYRIPFWRDSRTVVIDDFALHSENYRSRLRLGTLLAASDNPAGAWAEAMAAGRIFPEDPFVARTTVPRAIEMGYYAQALAEAQRARALDPSHARLAELVIQARLAQGFPDSALSVAREAVARQPRSHIAAEAYVEVMDSLSAPPWQRALAEARLRWLRGELSAASHLLDAAIAGPDSLDRGQCWDVVRSQGLIDALRPGLAEVAAGLVTGSPCSGTSVPELGR